MTGLPGYDEWKTRTPEDEDPRCEHCGASCGRYSEASKGWQPEECTGECDRGWRDPDAEYEAQRDRDRAQPGDIEYTPPLPADWDD